MNQAEVIHAGWAHRDPSDMSLLDVCKIDGRETVVVYVELKVYAEGTSTRGSGPSYYQRKRQQHVREVEKAKRLSAEVFQDDGLIVDPKTSCHPRQNRKRTTGKRNTSRRAAQFISTLTETSSQVPHLSQLVSPAAYHPGNSITTVRHSSISSQPQTHRPSVFSNWPLGCPNTASVSYICMPALSPADNTRWHFY